MLCMIPILVVSCRTMEASRIQRESQAICYGSCCKWLKSLAKPSLTLRDSKPKVGSILVIAFHVLVSAGLCNLLPLDDACHAKPYVGHFPEPKQHPQFRFLMGVTQNLS